MNVKLSVVAVSVMMFMMTACSSQEETMVLDDWMGAAGESSSEADMNDDTMNIMTVDEWVNSEEAVTYLQVFNNVYAESGITMELDADNETLSIILIYSEKALESDDSELTEEQMEEVHAMMQQQYDEMEEQLVSNSKVLKQEVGASTIRIVYRTSNGTELFSKDL